MEKFKRKHIQTIYNRCRDIGIPSDEMILKIISQKIFGTETFEFEIESDCGHYAGYQIPIMEPFDIIPSGKYGWHPIAMDRTPASIAARKRVIKEFLDILESHYKR